MKDKDAVIFLQWALPRLGMKWKGFRKVRGQVEKRIDRRMKELGSRDIKEYRARLEENLREWACLDRMCRITISCFYRDRGVFTSLQEILAEIAKNGQSKGKSVLKCWSAGCASGEEPYSVALIWHVRLKPNFPDLKLHITATDSDSYVLERGEKGCYEKSSMKNLPHDLLQAGFETPSGGFKIKKTYRETVTFLKQDIRREMPDESFHIILCRNLVFTYYDDELQLKILQRIKSRLLPGGALVIGIHESLPQGLSGFREYKKGCGIFLMP